MRKITPFIQAFTVAILSTLLLPLAQADEIVTCKSHKYGYTHCRTGPGSIRLQKKLSSSPCDQGRSWDYDNRGVWVDKGCKAEFIVENGRSNNSRDNNKRDDYRDNSSRNNRPATTPAGEQIAGISIFRNLKRSGADYKNFNSGNLQKCAQACANDGRCKAFNYGKEHADCHLKENVPQGTPNNTVISGVKN